MGVDTKGMVRQGVTAIDIADAIKSLYGETPQIHTSSFDANYNVLSFMYKDEQRQISVFENYDDLEDVSEVCTLLSFRMWGSSAKIMRDIVGLFGGMVMENDCDGTWEPVAKIGEIKSEAWVIDKELREKLREAGFNTTDTIRFHQFVKDNADYLKGLTEKIQ